MSNLPETKFLIRKRKPSTAHYFAGNDTFCRMYSTGGMNKRKYKTVEQSDLPICTMCTNATKTGEKNGGI